MSKFLTAIDSTRPTAFCKFLSNEWYYFMLHKLYRLLSLLHITVFMNHIIFIICISSKWEKQQKKKKEKKKIKYINLQLTCTWFFMTYLDIFFMPIYTYIALIGIHSMQGWGTTKGWSYGKKKKKNTKENKERFLETT